MVEAKKKSATLQSLPKVAEQAKTTIVYEHLCYLSPFTIYVPLGKLFDNLLPYAVVDRMPDGLEIVITKATPPLVVESLDFRHLKRQYNGTLRAWSGKVDLDDGKKLKLQDG